MNEMNSTLMILFWGAMLLNIITLALFISKRESTWLYLTPWIGLALGFMWFVQCRSYFAQPEVLLDVPIRIDLVLLPPLMAFALYTGVVRLILTGRKKMSEGKS